MRIRDWSSDVCSSDLSGGSVNLLHLGLDNPATICCICGMAKIDPNSIAAAGGVTAAYARMMIAGKRRPSLPLALRVYDATGVPLGPLSDLSRSQIEDRSEGRR